MLRCAAVQIELTEEEMAAVDRLAAMGFDRDMCIEAFLICECVCTVTTKNARVLSERERAGAVYVRFWLAHPLPPDNTSVPRSVLYLAGESA